MSELQIAIDTLVDTNYGDHGERVRTSHAAVPGETVEDLVRRVFPNLTGKWLKHNATDSIEIRVIVGADGTATGQSESTTESPW